MEGLLVEFVKALAAQGAAYTLLGLALTALAYVCNRWMKAESKCFDLSQSLNEKRITERSETITVLHASTKVNEQLANSIAVRTETLNNLITVVTTGNDRLERLVAEGLRRLEERRAPAN